MDGSLVGIEPRFRVVVRRGATERFERLAGVLARQGAQLIWDRRIEMRRGAWKPRRGERRRRERRGSPPPSWYALDFLITGARLGPEALPGSPERRHGIVPIGSRDDLRANAPGHAARV